MEGLQEVTNALSNGTIRNPLIYKAHHAVIFVIAQLSCLFSGLTLTLTAKLI